MERRLIRKVDDAMDNEFELNCDELVAGRPSTLSEIRRLVREWYGNLPVEILVINKKLQNAIMEFESLCDRGILDLDVLSLTDSSAV